MKIKSKLKGIDYRLESASWDRLTVKFSKNSLKEVISKQDSSFQLEVIKNGKLGSAAGNQPVIDELITKASHSAEFGDQVSYSYPSPKALPKVELFSPEVANLKPSYFIDLGQFLIDSIRQENPQILIDVSLRKSQGMSSLEHSGGFSHFEKGTSLGISVEGELVSEGDILMIGDSFSWRSNTFDRKEFAKKLRDKFRLSKKIVKFTPGRMTVVFTPEALSTLLDPLETALSAKWVNKKVSKWTDQMGKQVADSRFNMIDNPTIDFAVGSTMYDDEGISAQPLSLVEKGVLKNFYANLREAKKLGILPNGRGFGVPSSPSLTNIIIGSGSKPSQQLIKNIKHGVLIDQVIGGGQDSPYSGDFSLSIHLGFLIENGEILGRVKNYMVSGNIFEMLKNQLGDLSSDTRWLDGGLNFPSVTFNEVNVIGQ